MAAAMSRGAPVELGSFRVDQEIGYGGMGTVHRGEHTGSEALASYVAKGREGYQCFAHAGLLPCRAVAGDWARFDEHCAAVEAIVARSGLADEDIELGARLAGDLAARAGEHTRAERARAIAAAQRAARAPAPAVF